MVWFFEPRAFRLLDRACKSLARGDIHEAKSCYAKASELYDSHKWDGSVEHQNYWMHHPIAMALHRLKITFEAMENPDTLILDHVEGIAFGPCPACSQRITVDVPKDGFHTKCPLCAERIYVGPRVHPCR